jgi:hypothetical protein
MEEGPFMFDTEPSQGWRPALEPLSLHISEIEYECALWRTPLSGKTAGYIKFRGEYGHGSLGRYDAMFIQWCIYQFIEYGSDKNIMPLAGLIVDFRELHYVWGNNLQVDTLHIPDHRVCIVIPSQEENERVHQAYHWLGAERLRSDLTTAFRDVAWAIEA